MSSAPVNLVQYAWLLFALLFGGMQIAASILLLRERTIGPWLMLVGAVISITGHAATQVLIIFFLNTGRLSDVSHGTILSAMSGIGGFGALLFCGGLLLYAMTRRALLERVRELESILGSRPPA